MNECFCRKLIYKLVERFFSFDHIHQVRIRLCCLHKLAKALSLLCFDCREETFQSQLILTLQSFFLNRAVIGRKRFVGSIRKETFFQLMRSGKAGVLCSHFCLCQIVGEVQFLRISYIVSNVEDVASCLKNIGRFCNLSKVIKRCHIFHCKGKNDSLCLAWLQQSCFPVSAELFGRFAKLALRCAIVELYNFFSGTFSGVGNRCFYNNLSILLFCTQNFCLKAGVGKAEAERIIDLLRCARNRLEITVANVDILVVIHIINGFMEVLGGWIILEGCCIGINQFTGWVDVACYNVRCREAAFHAALPCHQHRRNLFAVFEPAGINHTADIHDNDDIFEVCFYFFYHGCFAVCQVEVAVFEDAGAQLDLFFLILKQLIAFIVDLAFAVPALAGETADGDDCGIGICFRFCYQLVRYFRLSCHARYSACSILLFYIFLIEFRQLMEQGNLPFSFLDLHAFVEVADILDRNVTASAAAFYVINRSFSE